MPFGPLHPSLFNTSSLVFVMSAGEGHHVVFLAPSPSFLPQSKFVLLFDLNTYPWLWTRESGGSGKRERAGWERGWGPGQSRILVFSFYIVSSLAPG